MFKFTAAEEAAQDRAERAEEAFAAEGIEEPGLSVFDFPVEGKDSDFPTWDADDAQAFNAWLDAQEEAARGL